METIKQEAVPAIADLYRKPGLHAAQLICIFTFFRHKIILVSMYAGMATTMPPRNQNPTLKGRLAIGGGNI